MTVFDIILLVIAAVLTLLGFFNGFCKMLLRAGATVAATILAGLFGGMLGYKLFGELVKKIRGLKLGGRFFVYYGFLHIFILFGTYPYFSTYTLVCICIYYNIYFLFLQ